MIQLRFPEQCSTEPPYSEEVTPVPPPQWDSIFLQPAYKCAPLLLKVHPENQI